MTHPKCFSICLKIILLLLIFELSFQMSFSQDWVKTNPFWNNLYPRILAEYYDHGYIFLADKYGTGAISYSIIIKTDINGNELWHKTIGDGNHSFIPSYIDGTSDHGLIFCGMTNKYGGVNPDPYLIKFNSCLDVEWCSVIQTPGIYDYAVRAKQLPNGEYIMLTAYSDPNEYNRMQLYKLSSTGNWVWKKNYPPTGGVAQDDPCDLTLLPDGYLITANCYYPDSGQTGGGAYERPYYIKTDTAGDDVWRLVYGSGNGYHGQSWFNTLRSSTGNFYSVGWHSNYCDTPALTKVTGNGNESYFQDIYPGTCPGGDGSINFYNDTTMVISVGGTINGNFQRKWIKLDTLGITTYSKEFPAGYMDGTGWTIVTLDKKIVGLSDYNSNIYLYKLNSNFDPDSIYTRPRVYDSLCPYPIVTNTINPDCGLLVNVDEPIVHPVETQLKIYPDPASDQVTVDFPKFLVLSSGSGKQAATTTRHQWRSTCLEVYDMNGKRVFTREIPQNLHELEMDVTPWKPGMFFFRLVYEGRKVTGRNLIIRR